MSKFPEYISKELTQPDRNFDMVDSDKESDEEDDYDMSELVKMTANSKTWSDILVNKNDIKNTIKKNNIKNTIKNNIKKNELFSSTIKIRQFNPRYPPPDKYKKHFKLTINDFPAL